MLRSMRSCKRAQGALRFVNSSTSAMDVDWRAFFQRLALAEFIDPLQLFGVTSVADIGELLAADLT